MESIISQFALNNEVVAPEPLKVGHINDSYVLKAKRVGDTSYFLQRINHHIFQDVEGLQHNIKVVTDHLRAKLVSQGVEEVERRVLRLVPTKEGRLYYRTPSGDYWRMYVLIENALSQESVTPESAYLVGRAFGEFQCQLSDLDTSQLCETIPHFHDMEYRLRQLKEAVRENPKDRVRECQDLLEAITLREEEMCLPERLFEKGELAKRINHCDTKVNNMMLDADGKPLCIVDLDTVMPGFVLSDFGDFMRTAGNKAAEDEPDLSKVEVNMDVFEAYARGYLEVATFLSPKEKELLPLGCRRMSYMQSVRFLTDYLNGDTYYKIAYPEHNLVRAKAQMQLLLKQESKSSEMEEVLRRL